MPGITPAWADSRRQIRQRPNLRNTARERPHECQRVYCWVRYFGVRDAFTRKLVLAMFLLYLRPRPLPPLPLNLRCLARLRAARSSAV